MLAKKKGGKKVMNGSPQEVGSQDEPLWITNANDTLDCEPPFWTMIQAMQVLLFMSC